jgi:hypothetical protein
MVLETLKNTYKLCLATRADRASAATRLRSVLAARGVIAVHLANQMLEVQRIPRPVRLVFPTPEKLEVLAVPTDEGLGVTMAETFRQSNQRLSHTSVKRAGSSSHSDLILRSDRTRAVCAGRDSPRRAKFWTAGRGPVSEADRQRGSANTGGMPSHRHPLILISILQFGRYLPISNRAASFCGAPASVSLAKGSISQNNPAAITKFALGNKIIVGARTVRCRTRLIQYK